jgi:hypothetical protein
MKATLRPGLAGTYRHTVPPGRTVPHIIDASRFDANLAAKVAGGRGRAAA